MIDGTHPCQLKYDAAKEARISTEKKLLALTDLISDVKASVEDLRAKEDAFQACLVANPNDPWIEPEGELRVVKDGSKDQRKISRFRLWNRLQNTINVMAGECDRMIGVWGQM